MNLIEHFFAAAAWAILFVAPAFDLRSLSVVSGKACWVVYVDAIVLNEGGNVLGALSLAARAALAVTRIPKVKQGMFDISHLQK